MLVGSNICPLCFKQYQSVGEHVSGKEKNNCVKYSINNKDVFHLINLK